jgi:hypothetical protein
MERQKKTILVSKSGRFELSRVTESYRNSKEWYGIFDGENVIHMADSPEFIDTIWARYKYQDK